jgi:hypothetical protein
LANEKKPEGGTTESASAPERPATAKRPAALGEGAERSVKRPTGAVPKWSTGPIANLEERGGKEKPEDREKGPPKRPSLPSKQPGLGAGGADKSVSKRASGRAGVVSLPPAPVPSTQPAVDIDSSTTLDGAPSPFAPPKPPAAFEPDEAPAKTSTDMPAFVPPDGSVFPPPPRPPAGYRPDDEESEKTSSVEPEPRPVVPMASTPAALKRQAAAQPLSENRDGSTVLKKADDIKRPDKPEMTAAKAFQAPKPPAAYKPEVAQLKTSLKPAESDDGVPTVRPAPVRVAEQQTNIKDISDITQDVAKFSGFEGKTALVPSPVGEIKKTAAAEQKAKEGKGAFDDKTSSLRLDGDEETTSGDARRPRGSGDTLPPDAPAVAPDGKPLDPKLAGAFSRAQAKEQAQEQAKGGKVTGDVKPPLTKDQKVALGVVGGGALLILVVLVGSLGSFKDRPAAEDLERCYPYGQNGAQGPNGQKAPPVEQVKFKLDQELDAPVSRDFEKCLIVKYEGPGVNLTTPFQGSMVMCKRWDKIWQRGNDDGMPFRITD